MAVRREDPALDRFGGPARDAIVIEELRLDPDNVLDQAATFAVQLLGADGASVRILEGDEATHYTPQVQ